MRRLALLATTVASTPVAFAGSNNYQQQQGEQQSSSPSGQSAQNQDQSQQSADEQQTQSNQQQSAESSQPISPENMSRGDIRQVQQALDKSGFEAGPSDGRWGPETENAVKQFQESKQRQPTGQLDQQTVADLGLDTSQFSPQDE